MADGERSLWAQTALTEQISLSCWLLNILAQNEYANCYFSSSICWNHPTKTINKRNKKFSV